MYIPISQALYTKQNLENTNGGSTMTTDVPSDGLLEKIKDAISNQSPIEKTSTKCPHHFGYLSELPKNQPIPEECLLCPKLLECKTTQ